MNRQVKFVILFAVAALIISGCKKKDDNKPGMTEFDRSAMLKDIADNVILPAHTTFVEKAEALSVSLSHLSANADAAAIEALQHQWLSCAVAWKRCQLFNVGTAQESYLHNKIHTWPANEDFINEYIRGNETLDEAFIASIGSSSKGLAAIEYLLFSSGKTAAVVDSLTAGPYADRKRQYLAAAAKNLKSVADDLNTIWAKDGRDYYSEFISSSGTGIGTGTNMLVNEMANMIEMMLNTKLGKPMGKHLNDQPQPELAEAYRSYASLALLKSNLSILQKTFHGGDDMTAIGIDDHLDAVGAKYDDISLSQKIDEQFEAVSAALNNITPDLEKAVLSNRQATEKAYSEVKALLVLFKVDVASNLSITLTLNDNDGD